MKIAILLYINIIGGAETVSLEIAKTLRSLGHDVFFIFPGINQDKEMIRVFENNKPFKIYENMGTTDRSVKRMMSFLADVINEEKPQVIISGFLEESYILLKAKRYIQNDFKLIMVNHNGSYYNYKKFWQDRINTVFSQADTLVTITKVDELCFKESVSAPILTIPNMPRDEFYSDIKTFENNVRGKKILALGRLVDIKGFDLLIDAFSRVKQIGWTLHIYGEGPEKERLSALISNLNLNDKVFLHPPTQTVSQTMNEHEFFVLPSTIEPYGMVLLEALMMGLPSISFACPNGPAVIESENPGSVVLVPNKDVQRLSQEIEILINNEDRRKELSEKAVKYRQIISRQVNAKLWSDVLSGIVS